MKKNLKIIVAFLLGVVITSCVAVYAANYYASDVQYKSNKSVDDALDELYGKVPSGTVQIASNGTVDVTEYATANVNVSSNMTYSTTEHVVGTWIDNKPIYQKTIVATVPTTSASETKASTTLQVGAVVDKFIEITGTVHYNNNGIVHPIPTMNGPDSTYRNFSNEVSRK